MFRSWQPVERSALPGRFIVFAILTLIVASTAHAQEVKIEKKQRAMVLFGSGKAYFGTLYSLNSREVHFQPIGWQMSERFGAKSVKAVQTDGGIFIYNSAKLRFEKQQDDGKQPKPLSPADFQPSKVVAEGLGETVEDALKDAFRGAIRQAVGAIVDAQTLIKNEEIISDKILTYSDGFVRSYKQLEKIKEDGLFRVKIEAVVERRTLAEKLKAANVATSGFDGQSLVADILTNIEAEKNARQLLANALMDFPRSVLKVEASEPFEVVDRSPESATLRVRIRVAVDLKAYEAFAQKILPVLHSVATARDAFLENGTFVRKEPAVVGKRNVKIELQDRNIIDIEGLARQKKIAVAIQTFRRNDARGWALFYVDDVLKAPLQECCTRFVRLNVHLLDSESANVFSDSSSYADPITVENRAFSISAIHVPSARKKSRKALSSAGRVFLISPVFLSGGIYGDGLHTLERMDLDRTLTLPLSQLAKVKSVRCELR